MRERSHRMWEGPFCSPLPCQGSTARSQIKETKPEAAVVVFQNTELIGAARGW